MQTKVDSSESALPEHLTYLIETELSLGRLGILSETLTDQLFDKGHFF